ncbi:hypothetical protein K439DRAFT_1621189 [Ramaria rubella]|nr:hypothetical protein K439DRAFT_1621189 [Ramaria rubella]
MQALYLINVRLPSFGRSRSMSQPPTDRPALVVDPPALSTGSPGTALFSPPQLTEPPPHSPSPKPSPSATAFQSSGPSRAATASLALGPLAPLQSPPPPRRARKAERAEWTVAAAGEEGQISASQGEQHRRLFTTLRIGAPSSTSPAPAPAPARPRRSQPRPRRPSRVAPIQRPTRSPLRPLPAAPTTDLPEPESRARHARAERAAELASPPLPSIPASNTPTPTPAARPPQPRAPLLPAHPPPTFRLIPTTPRPNSSAGHAPSYGHALTTPLPPPQTPQNAADPPPPQASPLPPHHPSYRASCGYPSARTAAGTVWPSRAGAKRRCRRPPCLPSPRLAAARAGPALAMRRNGAESVRAARGSSCGTASGTIHNQKSRRRTRATMNVAPSTTDAEHDVPPIPDAADEGPRSRLWHGRVDIGLRARVEAHHIRRRRPRPHPARPRTPPLPTLAARITWVLANFLEPLPFKSGDFDFVHVRRVARGVPEDRWDAFMEEVVRDLFFPGSVLRDEVGGDEGGEEEGKGEDGGWDGGAESPLGGGSEDGAGGCGRKYVGVARDAARAVVEGRAGKRPAEREQDRELERPVTRGVDRARAEHPPQDDGHDVPSGHCGFPDNTTTTTTASGSAAGWGRAKEEAEREVRGQTVSQDDRMAQDDRLAGTRSHDDRLAGGLTLTTSSLDDHSQSQSHDDHTRATFSDDLYHEYRDEVTDPRDHSLLETAYNEMHAAAGCAEPCADAGRVSIEACVEAPEICRGRCSRRSLRRRRLCRVRLRPHPAARLHSSNNTSTSNSAATPHDPPKPHGPHAHPTPTPNPSPTNTQRTPPARTPARTPPRTPTRPTPQPPHALITDHLYPLGQAMPQCARHALPGEHWGFDSSALHMHLSARVAEVLACAGEMWEFVRECGEGAGAGAGVGVGVGTGVGGRRGEGDCEVGGGGEGGVGGLFGAVSDDWLGDVVRERLGWGDSARPRTATAERKAFDEAIVRWERRCAEEGVGAIRVGGGEAREKGKRPPLSRIFRVFVAWKD